MGKIMSVMVRKANRFNVENRAERVISKDKPTVAPKYPSNLEDIDRVMNLYPNLVDELNKKDSALNDRLKQVYVTRTDKIEKVEEPTEKLLPLDRHTPAAFEYGFKEVEKVSIGRSSLRQAMQFLADHQANPELWTANKIAEEYKLKEGNVVDILSHFRAFHLHIPTKGSASKDQLLMEPKLSQKYLDDDKDK